MGALGRLRHLFRGPPDAAGSYVCLSCRARWDRQPQVCPNCGGYDIRRVKWLDDADAPETIESS